MLFKYHAIDQDGHERDGTIEASSKEIAVSALQRRSFIISEIESAEKNPFFSLEISFFDRVSNKDVVILSRQIATLFEHRCLLFESLDLSPPGRKQETCGCALYRWRRYSRRESHQFGTRASPQGLHDLLCQYGEGWRRVRKTLRNIQLSC